METTFKKVVLTVPVDLGAVNSANSLTWTPDSKLVVCCAEKLLIFSVTLVRNLRSGADQEIFTPITEEILSIHDYPEYSLPYGMLNFSTSFAHLKEVERHKVMTDPALMDHGFFQFPVHKLLKRAVCSSFFHSSINRQQYLISCVTYGFRVFIFTMNETTCKPCECTKWIKKQMSSHMTLPMSMKKKEDLDEYITLMHGMATVEIQWSQLFTLEDWTPFYLLITGSRNGHVHLWRVDANFSGKKEQFKYLWTDKYESEVMSLAWLPKGETKGVLAVGYVDGSIRAVEVALTPDTALSVEMKEIFTDLLADGVSVSDLAFGYTSQETPILLACKQYFLFLYTMKASEMQFYNHYHLDAPLPLVSLSLRGMYGVASLQDKAIVTFKIQETSDEITVFQTRQEMDMLSSNLAVPWFCMGAALSPSCSLCFSIHKTDYNLPAHKNPKRSKGKQMVVMSVPFKLSFKEMVLNMKDLQASTKDATLNVCLFIKLLVESSSNTLPVDQISDVLKSLREEHSKRGTQVALAVIEFVQAYLKIRIRADWHLDLSWIDTAYEEVTKECLSQHASSCLSCLPAPPHSDFELRIVSSLRQHLKPEAEETLDSSLPQKDGAKAPLPPCAICSNELSNDGPFTAKCMKGHKTHLCCLSLQPCQDFSSRKCETCRSTALSLEALSETQVIKDKLMCPMCGGCLRESEWT